MFARTKVDEFFHNKIKSIACLFDAYLLFTGLYSALVVFVTKSGLETSVVLGRRASLVASLEFLGDEREREVDLYTALFPREQLFLLFFSILFLFKFFKSASFFFLAQNTFDAGQRGYDVAAALVVLYDRIKIMENQALSFVHSSSMARLKACTISLVYICYRCAYVSHIIMWSSLRPLSGTTKN